MRIDANKRAAFNRRADIKAGIEAEGHKRKFQEESTYNDQDTPDTGGASSSHQAAPCHRIGIGEVDADVMSEAEWLHDDEQETMTPPPEGVDREEGSEPAIKRRRLNAKTQPHLALAFPQRACRIYTSVAHFDSS